MLEFIFFFVIVYIILALPVLAVIWAALVVAKQDDTVRGYDLLEGNQ